MDMGNVRGLYASAQNTLTVCYNGVYRKGWKSKQGLG